MKIILIFTGLLFIGFSHASEKETATKKAKNYYQCLQKNHEEIKKYLNCLQKADLETLQNCPEPAIGNSCNLGSDEKIKNKLDTLYQNSPKVVKEFLEALKGEFAKIKKKHIK